MKLTTLVKYIFIVFVVCIIVYAGYKIYDENNNPITEIENISQEEEKIIKDIRLAVTNYDTMNPLISNNREILDIDSLIFEPLFTLTKNYELEPCLATEWSKVDATTYIIKIDTSIKWQDGSYLTAKDVQFTVDKLKEGNSVYKSNVANIIGLEVVDASTVKLLLNEDVPFFEYNLTFPIMSNMNFFEEDFYSTSKIPIGTGRFKISDINSTGVTLVKNEAWKRAKKEQSKIENIRIYIFSSMGEVFNSFKLGNIDLINTTTQNYQDYIGTIGFNIIESKGREFDFISLNCQNEILSDKNVRQAISYAIDKENIVSEVYNNQKITAAYPLDYGNYLYSSDNSSSGYNAEQAKKILEDNGWSYNNGRWRKNINGSTKNLRLRLGVSSSNENRKKVAEIIKNQLGAIGIAIDIDYFSDEQYQNALANKNYQMLITGVYNSYSPNLNYYLGQNNISNYYNENILSIMNSGISSKNTAGLRENYKEILNTYKDEVPFIGLTRNKNITVVNQSLIGEVEPNNYSTYYNMENWYRK